MIRIDGNLDGVLARLERMERAANSVPLGVVKHPGLRPQLKRWASMVLTKKLPDQPALVAAIAEGVLVVMEARGVTATLRQPDVTTATVKDALDVSQELTTREYGGKVRRRRQPLAPDLIQSDTLANARAIIEEWVNSGEKELLDGDEGQESQVIVDRIYNFLFTRGPKETSAVQDQRERMVRAIDRWLINQNVNANSEAVNPLDLADWLEEVLDFWAVNLMRDLPAAVKQGLKKAWKSEELDLG